MAEKAKAKAKTKSKAASKKKEEEPETPPKPLEQLVLNRTEGKYALVPLAAIWAKEIKRQQENAHLSTAQVLDVALKAVLTGEVTWDSVKKLTKTSPAADGAAKKK